MERRLERTEEAERERWGGVRLVTVRERRETEVQLVTCERDDAEADIAWPTRRTLWERERERRDTEGWTEVTQRERSRDRRGVRFWSACVSVVRGEGGREEMGTWHSVEAGSAPGGVHRTAGARAAGATCTCGPQGGGELRAGDGGRVVGDS